MHNAAPRLRSVAASALAALLLSYPTAPALANVVAVSQTGSVVMPGGAAGAAILPVSLNTGLSGAASLSGQVALQSRLPSLSLPQARTQDGRAAAPSAAVLPSGTPAASLQAGAVSAETGGLQVVPARQLPTTQSASRVQTAPQAVPQTVAETSNKEQNGFQRVLSSIGKALRTGRTETLFEGGIGMGIVQDKEFQSDVRLDPAPVQPTKTEVAGVSWQRVNVPGAQRSLLQRMFRPFSFQATVLSGDPQDAAAVESALREHIRANPAQFGNLSPDAFQTVISQKVAGKEGLLDMVYVELRQHLNGITVDGSYLSFSVKMVNGKAVLMSSNAQLFPSLAVDTKGTLDDAQKLESAYERLGRPANSMDDLRPVGTRVMHLGGQWRTVALYHSESKQLIAAVDVATGQTFAWNPRVNAAAEGRTSGRGVKFDPVKTGDNLVELPMSHTEVTTSDGRKFYTDADGYFTLEKLAGVDEDAAVTVTAKLKGKYAVVTDKRMKDLVVTASVKPGERMQLLFNPQGADEFAIAQVNGYQHVNIVHDYVVRNGIDIARINQPIPVSVNDRRDCNAYYTPYSPSLNFFSSSARCINTAYDTVAYHEYGHFVDDMIGGIINGGLSEGYGDILSLYITAQPVLGEGFLKGQEKDYIRHGENTYQYNDDDEVHDQGQAWGGFGWKLRKALIESAKAAGLTQEEAEKKGAAIAEALVIPTFLANVRDIPAAIQAVLLRDVDANGVAPHFQEIQAAAAAHNIKVAEPKPGNAEVSLASAGGFMSWLAKFTQSVVQAFRG